MKKSEIKLGIKNIQKGINNFIINIENIMQPCEDITRYLDCIQNIENENNLELELNYDEIKLNSIKECIKNNNYTEYINENFDILISDLEEWQDDVSESKADDIQEKYIDVLNEIKDSFDLENLDYLECNEDLKELLENLIYQLNDIEL